MNITTSSSTRQLCFAGNSSDHHLITIFMEQNTDIQQPQPQPQPLPQQSNPAPYILPAHSNKLAMYIICTLFCCLVGGIIAIINSSKSNNLYNSALMTNDDSLKQNLFMQSEDANKTAQTWITVSLIVGILYIIVVIIAAAAGVLEELY